jgi:hypothetical protein
VIWIGPDTKEESQIAERWLVRRFIDTEAVFSPAEETAFVTRRNVAPMPSEPAADGSIAQLRSFGRLLEQHGLTTDPALLCLSEFVAAMPPSSLVAHLDGENRSSVSDRNGVDKPDEPAIFAFLDSIYRWIREGVQADLDRECVEESGDEL